MRFLIKDTKERKEVKLSVKDKKLLQLLIQNGRESISELSRKIQISKPAIVQKIATLKGREILLDSVLYLNVKIEEKPLFILQISTELGKNTEEINKKLLNIQEIKSVLWYNGSYNLLLGIYSSDIHRTIDEIEAKLSIKKIRILRTTANYFHPPHIFKEILDARTEYNVNNSPIKEIDKKILKKLSEDPRASILEISESIKSAPLTIKKNISSLLKNGSIVSFSTYVNPWACGKEVVSVSFVIKGRHELDKAIRRLLNFPQTGNVWEFDHEWNLNVVFWVSNQLEVNKLLEELQKECKGILDTEVMVLASMVGK